MIRIRKATPADATEIAPIMLSAMEDIIYYFIGKNDKKEALHFLTRHIRRPSNQYSYEYIFVAEADGQLVGQICLYPGADLQRLRHPVLLDLASTYDRTLKLPAETQSGEVYIDTIAVSPGYQGRGIGKMLLLYAVDLFVKRNQQVLGLLVNLDNPLAKKLYLNIGFTIVNRVHIFGAEMEHLQYSID